MAFCGVIFDMDGVLCDSEPFITEAAAKMFAQTYGLTVSHDDFKPFTGTGEDRFIGGVAEKHGVTLTMPRDKEKTYDIYLQLIQGRLDPLPGVQAFIEGCRDRGLKLAVASSADRIKVSGNLKQIGVPPEQFDAVLTGSDVTHKKPHPEVFLKAAEAMGLDPKDCLVVEDAISGCQAAKAAGCRCLGITTTFDAATLRDAGADWTAPDLSQVPDAALA